MKKSLALLFLGFWVSGVWGQPCLSGVINDYTPIIGFECDSTILTVGSTSGFSPGDKVLLIQMKGALVNQSNTASFGDVVSLGTCGNYEFNRIAQIVGNKIHLKFHLIRPYELTGKVQLVRVPEYENITTCNITCKPWDGTVGGILAIAVHQKLTLIGTLDATEKGFRGGISVDANASVYHLTDYYYDANPLNAAAKGEGIATLPNDKIYGRGKLANSGGGGNAHNAGGGGGGNGGNGGYGGLEYFNTPNLPTPGTNGVGGTALSLTGFDKIFLGGSGGAGHMNDLVGSNGGIGGGIIIIKANSVESLGGSIKSDGGNILGGVDVNDGQGGGGAGGTVLIETPELIGGLPCSLRGGRGGDAKFHVNSQIIGPGGGGGGGRLLLSVPLPSVSPTLLGGIQGIANQNLFNGAQAGEDGVLQTGLLIPEAAKVAGLPIPVTAIIDSPDCTNLASGSLEIQVAGMATFSINGGAFQASPLFENLLPGSYSVAIQYTNGCKADTTVFIPAPSPLAQVQAQVEQITCHNLGKIKAYVGSSGQAPFEFSLNGGPWQNDSVFEQLNAGLYLLTVSDADGCSSSQTLEILPFLPMTIQLENVVHINCKQLTGAITLSASNGVAPLHFSLENHGQIQDQGIFEGLPPGTFTARVTDGDACVALMEGIRIEADTATTVSHIAVDLCENEAFVLPNGNIVNSPGQYAIVQEKNNGCDSALVYSINVFSENYFLPNAFIPNDDGENDYFTVFANPGCFKGIKLLRVFNRWGELVFEGRDLPLNEERKGWSGQGRGRIMPADVYVFYVELERNDLSVIKKAGSVTLLR